ncbi:MAG: hypothetical protein H5U29_08680 [Pusillimonas sp.]|nr:hypothetical protein [Pusillimonas sp.]
MEPLGKSVDLNGNAVNVPTGPVVWSINPLNQRNVEYGKVLAKGITLELKGQARLPGAHSCKTALI